MGHLENLGVGWREEVLGADTFSDSFKKQTPCKGAAIIDTNQ